MSNAELAASILQKRTGRPASAHLSAWKAGRKFDEPREPIPTVVRELVLAEGPCVYCGSDADLVIDHVRPWSRGGRHDIPNLVAACADCNSNKSDRTLVEWDAERVQHAMTVSPKVVYEYQRLTIG